MKERKTGQYDQRRKKEVRAIEKKHEQALEQQKKSVRDQLWLLYYNQYLYEHGVITERERNAMKNKINSTKNFDHYTHEAR